MEKPSPKKRRSDLRVFLGRKSVGDLAASEQASTSTNDSSCHLNRDSALIDPDFAANPDWYLHQPNNSVLASQNSISQAVLNERDANIVNNSNVEELNLSSFDKRQINKILNSSVVVNKAEMEQLMKRKHAMPPDNAEMSEDDTVSIEIQQRRPTTLKRGVPKGGGESVEAYNAFQAITNHKSDSEEESVAAKKKTKSSSTASWKSKLHSDSDTSIEIPRKRPAFLKRRPKGAAANDEVDKELDDAFKKALELTSDSEDAEISKKILVPPSSEARERSKLLESSAHDDVSVEIPRRRPAFLKRGSRPARTSQDAYDAFKNITSGSEEEEEDVEDAIGAKDKLLETQNKLLETQNKLLETQNKLLETQNKLVAKEEEVADLRVEMVRKDELVGKLQKQLSDRPTVMRSYCPVCGRDFANLGNVHRHCVQVNTPKHLQIIKCVKKRSSSR